MLCLKKKRTCLCNITGFMIESLATKLFPLTVLFWIVVRYKAALKIRPVKEWMNVLVGAQQPFSTMK